MPLQAQLTQLQVGVGTANFTIMQDIFDRDTEPLSSSTGHAACRDNVQFVSLRDYSDQEPVLCRLAKLLPQVDVIFAMAPIPSQRTSFFEKFAQKGFSHSSAILQGCACRNSAAGGFLSYVL